MEKLIFEDLFWRTLDKMGSGKSGITKNDNDSFPIDYSYNSDGYRCEDFKDQKILTLGCSQTVGFGLPLEKTWPFLLSKKMDMSYANLAKGGDSMQAQVIKAFQFLKTRHKPEYIFGVFPITRMEMPYIKDVIQLSKSVTSLDKDKNQIQNTFLNNSNIQKFSKYPYNIEEILPEEVAIFYNFMFIQMLDQYCKDGGIKFFWTYYNDSSYTQIYNTNYPHSYFVENFLSKHNLEGCHLKHSKDPLFHQAADAKKFGTGHWGFHRHMHIAESMYNMI